MAGKERRRTLLLKALKQILAAKRFGSQDEWTKVKVGDSVGLYFPAGAAAVAAFADELNDRDPLMADGVRLHPNNIRHADTVGKIFNAIKQAYKNNKYVLVP